MTGRRNFWLVARHEYLLRVKKRSFLVAGLGFPLGVFLMITLVILTMTVPKNSLPLGYVDYSGVLAADLAPPVGTTQDWLETRRFASEPLAQSAMQGGQIQAFYVLPEEFMANGEVLLYYWEDLPGPAITQTFDQLVLLNLASRQPEAVQARLIDGFHLSLRLGVEALEYNNENLIMVILPFFVAVLFSYSVSLTDGYMLGVVSDEKENRTMEILLTSLSPEQLIGGKALGLNGVALTLMAFWLSAAAVGVGLAARSNALLQGFSLHWDLLLLILVFFIPTYTLITGLMIAVGAVMTERTQGNLIASLMNLVILLPFLLSGLILFEPDSPWMVALTLFPTSALIAIAMRWGFTIIPPWQLVLSWSLLVSSAALSVWFAARVFRAGMLLYGKGVDPKAIFQAVSFRRRGRAER